MSLSRVPLLLLALLAQAGAAPPIQIPAQEKAPHKFILGGAEPSGLCPDLLRAMQRVEPELVFQGYDVELSLSLIDAGLRNGSLGAACALLDRVDRHPYAKRLLPPLYRVSHRVLVRSDETARPQTLEELRKLAEGRAVIVTRGSSHTDFLLKAGFKIDDSTGDSQANLRKLLAGRARFFYGGEHALWRSVQAAGLTDRFRLLPAAFHEEPNYFWVSTQLPEEQARRVERALERLQASGELQRIVRHHHQQP